MAKEDPLQQDSTNSTSEQSPQNAKVPNDELIGRVASPPQLESTSEEFYFWVQRDRLVEKTQLVRAESIINGQTIKFYGVIEEVHRRSRKRDIGEEFDVLDGEVASDPEFKPEGVTYANVNVLRTVPDVLTPPIEVSKVYLGNESDAAISYGFDEMKRPMAVGQLRNGGSNDAGLARIDLAYLLGDNGGHLNVTGMAGAGTKSSFLLAVVKLLLSEADPKAKPEKGKEPLFIVPIILNVKGEDLMWIDRPNKDFQKSEDKYKSDWEKLDVKPEPFKGAEFYAPTEPGKPSTPTIDGCKAKAYSWSLSDVLSEELFPYLFGDDSISSAMMALVYDIIAFLTENDGKTLKSAAPKNWNEILQWIRDQAALSEGDRGLKMHQTGTWRAIYRRLWDILAEGESIFPRDLPTGQPLKVTRTKNSPPQVIDIHALSSSLQRFVVASIAKQVVAARSGKGTISSLRYVLVLDELNRFAPRNSTDPITQLLDKVASEMRSQGVLLFGAQQLASQVSIKVIENAAIRVLGRTGSAELQDKVWQSWDKSVRQQAGTLKADEKLVMQPTFRQPMFVKMPFPAWAMRREDIAPSKSFDQTPEV
ncbi:ATP-binding protein [Leptolyngbya sp. FACHB-541]|uniref:ATP-binding protein n=1 Tax=Leptolyngbya sp. FACHB-541 TaxID=2692810 RepID=UPI0016842409|nr:ATP-binding protein [Leptolyngbya sp. FACHB-541]MBD2001413.1 ATP-binding protein [Leptolyngbya sp. FACHB-541]